MRDYILAIIAVALLLGIGFAGCRKQSAAKFPDHPDLKPLAKTAKDAEQTTPAAIDPAIIALPETSSTARLRAMLDREEELAAIDRDKPGLFVLPTTNPENSEMFAWSKPVTNTIPASPTAYGYPAAPGYPEGLSAMAPPALMTNNDFVSVKDVISVPGLFFGPEEYSSALFAGMSTTPASITEESENKNKADKPGKNIISAWVSSNSQPASEPVQTAQQADKATAIGNSWQNDFIPQHSLAALPETAPTTMATEPPLPSLDPVTQDEQSGNMTDNIPVLTLDDFSFMPKSDNILTAAPSLPGTTGGSQQTAPELPPVKQNSAQEVKEDAPQFTNAITPQQNEMPMSALGELIPLPAETMAAQPSLQPLPPAETMASQPITQAKSDALSRPSAVYTAPTLDEPSAPPIF